MKVIPLEDIWVTANFKETQLRNMKAGQQADIEVDATGKTYKGHVDSIAGASGSRFSLLPPENATGNYVKVVQRIPLKIVFEKDATQGPRTAPRYVGRTQGLHLIASRFESRALGAQFRSFARSPRLVAQSKV